MENQVIKSKNYSQINTGSATANSLPECILTGIENFDDFFSSCKGIVKSSTILLTGSSGAGKTTLAKFLQKVLKSYKTSLYSRESTESQVQSQTCAIEITHGNDFICDKKTCPTFQDYLKELDLIKPEVVFVDSLQVIAKEDFTHMSEQNAIYEIIRLVREWGEENKAAVFVIGHVTKEDMFRGDNTLMQMVDAHLEMIYHKKEGYRTLSWGQKNRKGDVTKKLFYTFVTENNLITGLDFFTEKEFELKKEKIKFDDYLLRMVVEFISGVDKKHSQYKSIKAEYNSKLMPLVKSGKSRIETTIDIIRMIDELTKKYAL